MGPAAVREVCGRRATQKWDQNTSSIRGTPGAKCIEREGNIHHSLRSILLHFSLSCILSWRCFLCGGDFLMDIGWFWRCWFLLLFLLRIHFLRILFLRTFLFRWLALHGNIDNILIQSWLLRGRLPCFISRIWWWQWWRRWCWRVGRSLKATRLPSAFNVWKISETTNQQRFSENEEMRGWN